MNINILIHGYSKDCESEFMQYISKSIKDQGHTVYKLNLDYIKHNREPSNNLSEEILQLQNTIQNLKSKGYKKINLIGKSLGGILCLNPEIANINYINKIIILGFPYILGFPPNVNLLKTKPIIGDPNAKNLYKDLFNKHENIKKIYIIQGMNDLLGSPELIKDLLLELPVKPNVFYIENCSHGFKPVTKKTTLRENLSNIESILLKIL
jgi:predicted alpha/beta-hydrolase family hydrolase